MCIGLELRKGPRSHMHSGPELAHALTERPDPAAALIVLGDWNVVPDVTSRYDARGGDEIKAKARTECEALLWKRRLSKQVKLVRKLRIDRTIDSVVS